MDLTVASPAQLAPALHELLSPWGHPLCDIWDFLCRLLWMALLGGLITWLALDTARNPEQLISLAGFCFLVLFLFACSKHHGAVCVSGVAWPLVPLQEVATQHWRRSAPFPLASPNGPSLELPGGSRSPAGLLGRAGHTDQLSWLGGWSPKATPFPLLNSGLPHSASSFPPCLS